MPSGTAMSERKRDRGYGELERGWKPSSQIPEHRLTRHEGAAEIAVRELDQIGGELLPHRAVEQQHLAQIGNGLGRRRGPGEIHRGIARKKPGQHEGDDDHACERRQAEQKPSQNRPSQCAVLISRRALRYYPRYSEFASTWR